MNGYSSPFWDAYNSRDDLQKYGAEALLLFALQVKFGIEDIDVVASTSLTAGGDDKKADLVYIDSEAKRIVIAQSYVTENITGRDGKPKKGAPSDKAGDLTNAAAWLLTRPIDEVPDTIRSHAEEIRRLIKDNEIDNIQFWYVHNLPESKNVRNELTTVEHSAYSAIQANYSECGVSEVQAIEVGTTVLEEWYRSISTPILVNEEFTVPIPGGYELGEANWKSYTTAVQAKLLYELWHKYRTDLLSANVREYLGSREVDYNINNAIKMTARDEPEYFWVFNNGITALVFSFEERTQKNAKYINFKGISIVNGGQTIGAIGSLDSPPDDKAMVQVRFITCSSPDTVYDIVRYNNSQNKVYGPDFRSKDIIQTRLTEEFKGIPKMEYMARRGGYEDIIKRKPDTLFSITAGQALAAFHGDPGIAYHKKTYMWADADLYNKYFNAHTTAKHVLLAYSLLKSVDNKKLTLINKNKSGSLLGVEESQLDYFRKRGSTFLMVSAVSECLETIINKPIPNSFSLSFKKNLNPEEAIAKWNPIIDAASAFTSPLTEGLADGFKTDEKVKQAIATFQSLVVSTKEVNKSIYSKFGGEVI